MTPVRVFRREDLADVTALWQRCGLTRPWNDPARDVARKLTVQPHLFGVVDAPAGQGAAPGALIGSVMAGYDGHRGWINYLAVDPAWQRQGLGRQLMAWAEDGLRALGCPKINLQIRVGNEAARAFYARLGFGDDEVVSMGKRLEAD